MMIESKLADLEARVRRAEAENNRQSDTIIRIVEAVRAYGDADLSMQIAGLLADYSGGRTAASKPQVH